MRGPDEEDEAEGLLAIAVSIRSKVKISEVLGYSADGTAAEAKVGPPIFLSVRPSSCRLL